MRTSAGRQALQQLAETHYLAVYRYAFRLSGSAADAEDLTQEAFVKAQSCIEQLRDLSRAKPWLFSILRNEYLHRIRADKQQRCLSLDAVPDVPDSVPETHSEVDQEKLQQALNDLPEGFRSPVILFYFEDFSYRDISEQMDLPLGTVMSRLARAKAYLRGRLMPPGEETGPPPRRLRRATDGL
jgi:RNA polymerase sigma-70 factor (ECF subfamily)